jgi:uncharacterized membrane protein YphA (DoxX/SURF4 family)
MDLLTLIVIIFSSLSFIAYGILCLYSKKLIKEFERFGLKNYRILVGVLELLGGIGLLVGLIIPIILSISAGGLALLMLLGFGVRLKMKDGFWISFPSLFFMILNFYVFLYTIN